MPLNPIIVLEIFYVWCIDFVGPFSSSFENEYIFLAIEYVSKQVEVIPTGTNDAKVVMKFLRENIFAGFGMPRAIVNDQGDHLSNRSFDTFIDEVPYIAQTYHPI